jgi:hypothetical protein
MVAVGHTAEWPTSTLPKDDAGTPSPASSFLWRLPQHGFELPLHPFKRAAQLDDDGKMRRCSVGEQRVVRAMSDGRAGFPRHGDEATESLCMPESEVSRPWLTLH